MTSENFVIIGKIEEPINKEGVLKVKNFAPVSLWENLKRFYLKHKSGEYKPFEIEYTEFIGEKKLALKLKGIDTFEEALRLSSAHIFLPEKELPPLEEGEYYHFQLVGCEVYNEKNEYLGKVEYVQEGSFYPFLVLNNEVLIPFTEHFIVDVDLKAKKITVRNLL
jgi:16S rRNA processing protein RimM